MEKPGFKGRCLCGAVQFEARGLPSAISTFCHCRMCQRFAGAPMIAWVSFPKDAVVVTQGSPVQYCSSHKGIREFCGTCGSSLFFRDILPAGSREDPAVDVAIACLDNPDALPPQGHLYVSTMRPWLKLADGLPYYE
eukprot:jgi/Botrbrau1/3895/Bobra.0183s0116.1